MTATTAKTHFCILSDTHTVTPFPPNDRTHAYRYLFPASDVLIHCGDITTVGYLSEYETIFNFLKAAPAELKLVIAGNHDITLHKELYLERLKEKHGNVVEDVDRIREMWVGEEARRAGIVYLEEGVRRFELSNGASFTVSVNDAVLFGITMVGLANRCLAPNSSPTSYHLCFAYSVEGTAGENPSLGAQ